MVGLVLVSHSRPLAEAARKLVLSMTGEEIHLALAAGVGENREDLGTDAMEILEAIQTVETGDGAVVLMDMGSAILSAETAIDFLDEEMKKRVRLCSASFIEGAVAAGVACKLGHSLELVIEEARGALHQKQSHLGDEIKELPSSAQPVEDDSECETTLVTVINPMGIHARPAARLAQKASQYEAKITLRNLVLNKGPLPARSLTGLVSLEARKNHQIEICATGVDKRKALDDIKSFFESGLGDPLDVGEGVEPKQIKCDEYLKSPSCAIGISKGIAVGPLYFPNLEVQVPSGQTSENFQEEWMNLKQSLQKTKLKLEKEAEVVSRKFGKERGEIFVAQSLVLDDPVLLEKAESDILKRNYTAISAWWNAIQEAMQDYQKLADPILRARAADLKDAGREVLREMGFEFKDQIEIPEAGIIVLDDITPNQVAHLDEGKILGVILREGSKASHSAILLRSRGIPAVARASGLLAGAKEGTHCVILNGESGEILLNPDAEKMREMRNLKNQQEENLYKARQVAQLSAETRDHVGIEIDANIGSLEDAERALKDGADGVGLLRTEFFFMDRETPPSEDEQFEVLSRIGKVMEDLPVIVRTLDAGGDKNIPYLDLPKEENPFLGVRAIRLCLKRRDIFQTHLRAILRAAAYGNLKIMFPMIATVGELEESLKELKAAHEYLQTNSVPHKWPIPTGMMMEIPSAAILADEFAEKVDFFSIGTNDLTQYTMAADRGNQELQKLANPLNPAVVHLIQNIVSAAARTGIPVSVCGEAAADIHVARVFLRLGIRKLSMTSRSIPEVKQWVREQELIQINKESSCSKTLAVATA